MPTILIIDDDPEILETLSKILQIHDFETLEAPHGNYGLRLLEQHSVDVVLTDVNMPVLDGTKITIEAKKNWPGLKVITMSGGAAAAPFDIQFDADGNPLDPNFAADAALRKPFASADLIATIKDLVGSPQAFH